jgi:hypothetical protein
VYLNSQPIANVKVALIPHPNYSNEIYSFQDMIDESYDIQVTNSEGWVEFKDMPVEGLYNRQYSVFVYKDSNNYRYSFNNNQIWIYRDFVQNFTIEVNL